MAKGIERFSAPPPGDEFDRDAEAQFRRLIEQFMENADYRVRDVGDDVSDHESRIAALEGQGALQVIDSGAATVSGGATTVITSDPAIGSGSIGICIVSKDMSGPGGAIDDGSRFHLHNSAESTSLSMGLTNNSGTHNMAAGVGVALHVQHPGTPDHYDLTIVEGSGGSNVTVQYVIAELIV